VKLEAMLVAFGLAALASGQVPDVRLQLNATGSFATGDGGPSSFRYYSLFGRPSVASLRFILEPGFTGYVSEKLQRIPHDGDPDQIDQAYVEDEGIWRVGKQLLPFGSQEVLHETAIGARADTSLFLEGLPVAAAICDGGPGRQRGVIGRIGTRSYGFSAAVGDHFGIDGNSLTEIRLPEDTPGVGRGWSNAYGGDVARRIGRFTLKGEVVLLRDSQLPSDGPLSVYDLSAVFTEAPFETITFGYTRETETNLRTVRIRGSLPVDPHVIVEPFVRFRNARLWDIGAEMRIRL